MDPQQYNPAPAAAPTSQNGVENPLSVMQPGEQVICEIRRHPIGLFGIYAMAALIMSLTVAGVILLLTYVATLTAQQQVGLVLTAGLVAVVTLIVTWIASYVYQGNRWVVTSDSITEIQQISLFNRQADQLSLANLEDISAAQNGIIQQLLGYGDLEVETAGAERHKFKFQFCPDPNDYARKIIAARESFMQRGVHGSGLNERVAMAAAAYGQQAAQQPPQYPPAPGAPTA